MTGHRDLGLYTCKWARQTFDSAQDHHSRDLLRAFRSAATMACSVSHRGLHGSNGQGESFQRYLNRVCRPWRCWDRPVWPNRGELCAERGEICADSLKLIPVVSSSFFRHLSAWAMIFFVPCESPLRWDVNITERVGLSKKAGSSRSEASWMRGSIT